MLKRKDKKRERICFKTIKQGYTYKEIEADSQIGEEDGEEREGIKLARIKYIKSKLVADGKITEEEIEKILKSSKKQLKESKKKYMHKKEEKCNRIKKKN